MTMTKCYRLYLCIVLFAMAAPSCTASPETPSDDEKLAPLAISGIEPGMSSATVVKRLGNPIERKELEGFIAIELRYPSIVVGFDEFEAVALIESRSEKACILKEICPGATLGQMQRELERHGYLSQVHAGTLVINGDGCWGEIPIVNDRASAVRINCPP